MRCSAHRNTSWFAALALVAVFCGACASAEALTLQIGQHVFQVEVAATQQQRARGLMQRNSLAPDGGMLFVFEQAAQHCFWMRNTPLPLSIAFIDDAGHIAELADMRPNTDTRHCPVTEIRYALEIAQGGFRRRGIAAGSLITGLPQ